MSKVAYKVITSGRYNVTANMHLDSGETIFFGKYEKITEIIEERTTWWGFVTTRVIKETYTPCHKDHEAKDVHIRRV